MAPQTRRLTFPKVFIERETDSEPSSSDEEEEEEEVEEEEEEKVVENKNVDEERMEESLEAKKKGKAPITISLKKVCKVKRLTL
jgi:DNA damage-binding protein 2